MSTAAVSVPQPRPAVNPWLVAAAVVVPTFMEVLDTTIANVALRYIAGGLSASEVDSEWVITSYLAANATILPISGWISARLGRRNYFLLSIAVFTLASALCGMATSLNEIILFRVLQGLAGGGLQPSSQGVLLDRFPPEKQGAAMTLFGMAALVGPIVGPTLGGYLTDNYNWRWIFYINVPIGIMALLACYLLLEDPDYLKKERAELLKSNRSISTPSAWGCWRLPCLAGKCCSAKGSSGIGSATRPGACRRWRLARVLASACCWYSANCGSPTQS